MIFKREHKSQMYSPSAFFLSKTLSDLPFQVWPYAITCVVWCVV
jgi:hypothetical protein